MYNESRNMVGCQFFHRRDLPEGWDCVPLEERIELLYGAGLREEDRKPGDIPVFGSNGIVGTHRDSFVKGPGILVGRKGTVGAVNYSMGDYWPIDTVYYVSLTENDSLRYIYHLLQYLPLDFLNAATGVPGLSRRDAYALRGAFPPPKEQAAIARILDAADTAIARTRDAIAKSLILDHSLLHDLLEHGLPRNRHKDSIRPQHWPVKRVDEVAEVGSGVTLGKDVSGFKSVECPYLRVANVQDGHLDLTSVKTVNVRVDEVERYRLEVGDVLMTEGGDLDKLGRGTIWSGQIPDCLHQNHIFRIRANREMLDPRFFSLVVESDIAKRYFVRVAKRTTNLASTNKTQVRAFRFPVPPLSEQYKIAGVVASAKSCIEGLQAKENALLALKKSLMRDLLTGAVRVNNTAGKYKGTLDL